MKQLEGSYLSLSLSLSLSLCVCVLRRVRTKLLERFRSDWAKVYNPVPTHVDVTSHRTICPPLNMTILIKERKAPYGGQSVAQHW
jgi:hypothetical protein